MQKICLHSAVAMQAAPYYVIWTSRIIMHEWHYDSPEESPVLHSLPAASLAYKCNYHYIPCNFAMYHFRLLPGEFEICASNSQSALLWGDWTIEVMHTGACCTYSTGMLERRCGYTYINIPASKEWTVCNQPMGHKHINKTCAVLVVGVPI